MGMLLKDPFDPETFRNVIVDKPDDRELKLKAAVSEKNQLLNTEWPAQINFQSQEVLPLRPRTKEKERKPFTGQGFTSNGLSL